MMMNEQKKQTTELQQQTIDIHLLKSQLNDLKFALISSK